MGIFLSLWAIRCTPRTPNKNTIQRVNFYLRHTSHFSTHSHAIIFTTWHHVQIISPIVTFSSELLQISSELVLFSSEPVSRMPELLIINAFKITTNPNLVPHQSPAMPRSAILNSFTYIQIQTPNKTHFINHTAHTTNPNNAPWTPNYRKNKDKYTTPYKKNEARNLQRPRTSITIQYRKDWSVNFKERTDTPHE